MSIRFIFIFSVFYLLSCQSDDSGNKSSSYEDSEINVLPLSESNQSEGEILQKFNGIVEEDETRTGIQPLSLLKADGFELQVKVYYHTFGSNAAVGKVTWGQTSTTTNTPAIGFLEELGSFYHIVCQPGSPIALLAYLHADSQLSLTDYGDMNAWNSGGARFFSQTSCPTGKHYYSKTFQGMKDNLGENHHFTLVLQLEGRS